LDVARPGDPDRKATGRRKTVKGLIAANDFLVLRSEEQGRRHPTAIPRFSHCLGLDADVRLCEHRSGSILTFKSGHSAFR
jgi:hypothetical protein